MHGNLEENTLYPHHDGLGRRSTTPLLCIFEMGGNSDLFRSVAEAYELEELALAHACLAMALDRMYGCGTGVIENRVRQWLEADDRSEFAPGQDTGGLFAGLVTNMSYLADVLHGVLTKTIDPRRYELIRADRVQIVGSDLYLFLAVVEALV